MPPGAPPVVHRALNSTGHPLDGRVRTDLESRLGQDFSGVTVHTDAAASDSARAVAALAYTVGPHVVFGSGQYRPRSPSGQSVLAHELAHVAQQHDLPHGTPQALTLGRPGDAYERQADRFAETAAAGRRVTERPLSLRGAVLQRLGFGSGVFRFFGIEAGTFSEEDLIEYLDRVSTNRRCDCGFFDFLSDDKAREVIARWKFGAFSLDKDYKGVSPPELKRILIQELLAGPTGDRDERAIITVFDKSDAGQIDQILDPTMGVSIQDILDNVGGDNQKELLAILEKKLPDIGVPHLARTDEPAAPEGACTVDKALQVHYAKQTADRLVTQAIEALDALAARPAENKNVQRLIDCYFRGASPAQVAQIRGDFKLVADVVAHITFRCPSDPFTGFNIKTPTGVTDLPPEEDLQARALVEDEAPPQPSGGAKKGPAVQGPAPKPPNQVALFPDFFSATPDEQARIVIHEAFHHAKKQRDGDVLYAVDCGAPPLAGALTNAQSYAMFAAHLAQGGLHVAFEDCPAAWKSEIVAATRTAEVWVADALTALDGAITNPKSASSRFGDRLKKDFHTTPDDTETLRAIRETLAEIQGGFRGEMSIECEADCDPDVAGYTGGFLGIFPRGGNIHVCRHWFERLDHEERSETILHEMAHRYAGKGFTEVYRKGQTSHQYSQLTTEGALGNADSFAQFARTLQQPGPSTPPPPSGPQP
jgi:hypothetical protein